MHIAIDARIINSSTGRYVERLLHYLQTEDTVNQYTVLVPSKDRDFWKPSSHNFSVEYIDFPNYSFKEQIGFKRYLDTLSADLVHFCMPQQPILYKGSHVTTFHDLTLVKTYNSDKNWFIYHAKQAVGKFVFKRIARHSDHIITPSEFTKQELINFSYIPETKVTVTYESADIAPSEIEHYESPYKDFLLYVGQQSDYKNIKRLAAAHQRLLKKYPDLGLILAGRKNDAVIENEEYFTRKGYKNIHFTGFISDAQRDWLYKNTRAYIFPSLMEGFGLPGLEAMGYGAPVVSSNETCLPEIYGQAAHYFNPRDITDIAKSIDEVLSNPILRLELVKLGHAQVRKYSWQRMAQQTLAVYTDVLETKSSLEQL